MLNEVSVLSQERLHECAGELFSSFFAGEFPHQIMLTRGVGGSLMCGGSLVAPDVVITAGHCCDG